MARILIAEDDAFLRDVYVMILENGGFDIDAAVDGAEAYEYYQANSYDIVLLDLMMPNVDGVRFLQLVKAYQRQNRPKIIVFSNLSSGAKIEEAIALGADKSVLKAGLSPEQLIEFIQNELGSS